MLCKPAIGVDNDHDLGGIRSQMPKAPIQRISLANSYGIMTHDDLCSRRRRGCRGVIGTIVRDDEQPVTGEQLRPDVVDRRAKSRAFVVRGHENRDAPARLVARARRALPPRQRDRRTDLETEHGDGNGQQTGQGHERIRGECHHTEARPNMLRKLLSCRSWQGATKQLIRLPPRRGLRGARLGLTQGSARGRAHSVFD